jgi:hypothetical protein
MFRPLCAQCPPTVCHKLLPNPPQAALESITYLDQHRHCVTEEAPRFPVDRQSPLLSAFPPDSSSKRIPTPWKQHLMCGFQRASFFLPVPLIPFVSRWGRQRLGTFPPLNRRTVRVCTKRRARSSVQKPQKPRRPNLTVRATKANSRVSASVQHNASARSRLGDATKEVCSAEYGAYGFGAR